MSNFSSPIDANHDGSAVKLDRFDIKVSIYGITIKGGKIAIGWITPTIIRVESIEDLFSAFKNHQEENPSIFSPYAEQQSNFK